MSWQSQQKLPALSVLVLPDFISLSFFSLRWKRAARLSSPTLPTLSLRAKHVGRGDFFLFQGLIAFLFSDSELRQSLQSSLQSRAKSREPPLLQAIEGSISR